MQIVKFILAIVYLSGLIFNLSYIVFFDIFRDFEIKRNRFVSYVIFPLGSYLSWLAILLIVGGESRRWR
ncbi:MAG: hypothetical protein ACOCRO_04070 [Halanaerobiales bacterium]